MVAALISLLVVAIFVAVVAYLLTLLVDMLPMDVRFRQIIKALVILVAVLIIILRALPLIDASLAV